MNQFYEGVGYIINTHNLSDSSLIIHLYLHERGRIKVVAKGALTPKSPYRGMIDLFNKVEVLYSHPRGDSDLHPLHELNATYRHAGLSNSYPRLLLASYYSLLIDYWMEGQPDTDGVFDLYSRALSYADTGEIRWRGITYFEEELSHLLGYSKRPEHVYKLHQATARLTKLRQQVKAHWGNDTSLPAR